MPTLRRDLLTSTSPRSARHQGNGVVIGSRPSVGSADARTRMPTALRQPDFAGSNKGDVAGTEHGSFSAVRRQLRLSSRSAKAASRDPSSNSKVVCVAPGIPALVRRRDDNLAFASRSTSPTSDPDANLPRPLARHHHPHRPQGRHRRVRRRHSLDRQNHVSNARRCARPPG